MTVSKINPVNNYAGDSSVTRFDFDFLIEDEKELLVQHTDSLGVQTTLTLDVDYSINEIGNKNGSYINFPLAGSSYSVLAEDEIISLSLELDIEQDKEYANSSKLNLTTLEWSLDYIVRILQTMSRKIARSVKVQEGSTQTADELIEALQEAQINASNSAAAAATSATSADTSATSAQQFADDAEESYNNTVAKYDEVVVTAEAEKTNITTLSTEQQSAITTLGDSTLDSISSLSDTTLANLATTAQQQINNVQALGIFMEGDRLFYYNNGVKYEFRNDFGGIAPMPVKHKEVKKVANGFALTWTDPDDSAYQDNVYCAWGNTVIVRKVGSYPESPFDGDIVLNETVRNAYASTPYIDEVDNTIDYKYRAFPCSINKVFSYDDKNKFGQWIYSFTRMMNESIPTEKIVYRGTNEHYKPVYMDFSSDTFKYEDWANAPFLLKDRLAPCAVGFDGELKYFLDPNDYTKKEDGTASDIANASVNNNYYIRVKLLFRRKRKDANGDTAVDISNIKVNDEYKPYGGFVKPDGTLREYIYLPIYQGSLVSGKCRSISGQVNMNTQTAQNERNYCKANGEGHDMITAADRELIEDLTLLIFKTTDLQTALGQGYIAKTGASGTASTAGWCIPSGTMNTKGLFYGSSATDRGVKLFGIENFYANQWWRVLGEVLVNGVRKVKLCQGTSDGSTVEDFNFTGDGYITLSELPVISGTSGGYISKCQTVDDTGTYPIVISGSSSTYECDGMWFNNSGTMVALRGGDSNNGALCGLFSADLNAPASDAYWSIGSAVSFKPL